MKKLLDLSKQNTFFSFVFLFFVIIKIFELSNLGAEFTSDDLSPTFRSMVMFKNKLDPDYFTYNHIIFYLTAILNVFFFLFKFVAGSVKTPDDFYLLYLMRPELFFLLNRILMSIFLLMMIFYIYRITLKLAKNKLNSLLALMFISFNICVYAFSHVIKPSLIGIVFILILIDCLLLYDEKKRNKYLVLASFFTAAAFSAKVTYGISFLILFTFLFFKTRLTFIKRCLCLCYSLGFSFLLNPWLFIRLGDWIDHLRTAQRTIGSLQDLALFVPVKDLFLIYFPQGLSMIPYSVLALFFIYFLYSVISTRAKINLDFIIPAILVVIFYFGAQNYSAYRFFIPVYVLLPLVIFSNIRLDFRKEIFNKGFIFLIVIIAIPLLLNFIKFTFFIQTRNTGSYAKAWIEENIPPGSVIALDGHMGWGEHGNLTIIPDLETMKNDGLSEGSNKYRILKKAIENKRITTIYSINRFKEMHYEYIVRKESLLKSQYVITSNSNAYLSIGPNAYPQMVNKIKPGIIKNIKDLNDFLERNNFRIIKRFSADIQHCWPGNYLFPQLLSLQKAKMAGSDIVIYKKID